MLDRMSIEITRTAKRERKGNKSTKCYNYNVTRMSRMIMIDIMPLLDIY